MSEAMRWSDSIRAAVAAGKYTKARSLWEEATASLRQEVVSGGLSAGRLEETRELVEWTRQTVRLAQVRALDGLQQASAGLHAAQVYGKQLEVKLSGNQNQAG